MLRRLHLALGLTGALAACDPAGPKNESVATSTTATAVEAAPRPSAPTQTPRPTTASRGAPPLPSASADDEGPPARQPREGACTTDGLLAKGTVRTARIDLHSYARLLGETFKKDVVIAGDLASPKDKAPCAGWCLDFEVSAKDFEQAFALTGAPLTMRRGAALISYRTQPTAAQVVAPSPAVDLSLVHVTSSHLTKILGAVSKREIADVPEGGLSVLVRRRPALDVLALVADAAGATLTSTGTHVSFAGGHLPGGGSIPLRGADIDPSPQRDVLAASEDIGAMQVVALIQSPDGTARAALRSPASDVAWTVKVGDFIGKPRSGRVGDADVMVNARVERIHCLGVEFIYEDKTRAWLFLK